MARAASKFKQAKSRKTRGVGENRRDAVSWSFAALAVVAAMLALRLLVNTLELVPVHFDEAQYWAYGQELAWGYFSKPPLAGAVIRLTTELGGDTLFWLRVSSPIAHALVALLIFMTGRRIWTAQTGFWAAAGYNLAPGVGASSMLVSTDPIMMVAWAGALYALIRALESRRTGWWLLVGSLIGLGMLTKYTAVTFFAGLIGYMLFSQKARDWRGLGLSLAMALVVFAPNLFWNWANDFATVTHVAEDADPGQGYLNPINLVEFLGAQLGVIGPVFFVAILIALWTRRTWRDDQAMTLMAWQTASLLLPIIALAFVTRAQPNWAAPAYVAGSLFAARWLMTNVWRRGLILQLGTGAGASIIIWAAAFVYHEKGLDLPRNFDPFKKMRLAEPFCAQALGAMGEEGASVLLSDNRRRLSECMFMGGLSWDEIAVWNPELTPENHHELVATLRPGDDRLMLLAVIGNGERIAQHFDEAREIDAGRFETHSDRGYRYSIWAVQGFRDYP